MDIYRRYDEAKRLLLPVRQKFGGLVGDSLSTTLHFAYRKGFLADKTPWIVFSVKDENDQNYAYGEHTTPKFDGYTFHIPYEVTDNVFGNQVDYQLVFTSAHVHERPGKPPKFKGLERQLSLPDELIVERSLMDQIVIKSSVESQILNPPTDIEGWIEYFKMYAILIPVLYDDKHELTFQTYKGQPQKVYLNNVLREQFGVWNPEVEYYKYAMVIKDGKVYLSEADDNKGNDPETATLWWQLIWDEFRWGDIVGDITNQLDLMNLFQDVETSLQEIRDDVQLVKDTYVPYTANRDIQLEKDKALLGTNKDGDVNLIRVIDSQIINVNDATDLERVGTGAEYPIGSGVMWTTDAKYRQTADITLPSVVNNHLPIGGYGTPFTGIYDGGGHVIKGLNMAPLPYVVNGLFSYIAGDAIVMNLGVEGSITSNGSMTGGIVSWMAGNSKVINCYSSVQIQGTGSEVGGIAGRADDATCLIQDCYYSGAISCTPGGSFGGILGWGRATIKNCYNTGDVTGTVGTPSAGSRISVGGVAGAYNGKMSYCYNTGTITINQTTGTANVLRYAGGLIGSEITGASLGTVDTCYNKGNVSVSVTLSTATGTVYAGGLFGSSGTEVTTTLQSLIKNCYNTGDVTGTFGNGNAYVGGISGTLYTCLMVNCYSTGIVNAVRSTGTNAQRASGIGGGNVTGGPGVVNCYFLTATLKHNGVTQPDTISNPATGTISSIYIDGVSVPPRLVSPNQSSGAKTNSELMPSLSNAKAGTTVFYTGVTTNAKFGDQDGWDFNYVWSIDPAINGGFPYIMMPPKQAPLSLADDGGVIVGDILTTLNINTDGSRPMVNYEHQIAYLEDVEAVQLDLDGFKVDTNGNLVVVNDRLDAIEGAYFVYPDDANLLATGMTSSQVQARFDTLFPSEPIHDGQLFENVDNSVAYRWWAKLGEWRPAVPSVIQTATNTRKGIVIGNATDPAKSSVNVNGELVHNGWANLPGWIVESIYMAGFNATSRNRLLNSALVEKNSGSTFVANTEMFPVDKVVQVNGDMLWQDKAKLDDLPTNANLNALLNGKVDKNQGIPNAGKYLGVGIDGLVTLITGGGSGGITFTKFDENWLPDEFGLADDIKFFYVEYSMSFPLTPLTGKSGIVIWSIHDESGRGTGFQIFIDNNGVVYVREGLGTYGWTNWQSDLRDFISVFSGKLAHLTIKPNPSNFGEFQLLITNAENGFGSATPIFHILTASVHYGNFAMDLALAPSTGQIGLSIGDRTLNTWSPYLMLATADDLDKKVDKDQGIPNAGKVMTVGFDGKLTPQPASGGSTLYKHIIVIDYTYTSGANTYYSNVAVELINQLSAPFALLTDFSTWLYNEGYRNNDKFIIANGPYTHIDGKSGIASKIFVSSSSAGTNGYLTVLYGENSSGRFLQNQVVTQFQVLSRFKDTVVAL